MLRGIVALNNARQSLESANVRLDPKDAFPECTNLTQLDGIGNSKIRSIVKDGFFCIVGSCMLAGKGDYEVINARPTKKGESYEYIKSSPVQQALASLGTVTGPNESQEPVTKVKCISSEGCRIQYMEIPISYYYSFNSSNTSLTIGSKSIVSTNFKGKMSLDVYYQGSKSKK
ncbi:hypothetical protein TVAG_090770 [Trichomonas vaginalis G3]|uniref:Uncharacterized protein n=1 Tax=Trichomonas vaginalis (strain ATCC PRA-98 / G3) TaxID=412133 RepID=A2F914_TRIV3|nr:hypothetical protein TVAGG3_0827940 [Trichomonas vaginalis G3]EAX98589.1 hypothetical protein TVAG_090770 [Trichomonas vaginalis G3]KAI5498378.1 hypothetical protein TVAGG3_0827940 [Trichomonas vaginalis G3]|eukprot:XP_001311519.1 hypothetical protein [Trichomonas vaginalis G3]